MEFGNNRCLLFLNGVVAQKCKEWQIGVKAHPATSDASLYRNSEISVLSIIRSVPVWCQKISKGY
jgi:hypothetical protein